MRDNKILLLNSVKTIVAQNGITGLSTRAIAEAAGLNDAVIYRYFKDKDDLLRQAYDTESNSIFYAMLSYLDEVHGVPLQMEIKVRLVFHRVWRELLSDSARLHFVVSYYHSSYFRKDKSCHSEQVEKLITRLGELFPNDYVCTHTMYALMSVLYDSAERMLSEGMPDSLETEETMYSLFYGLLSSQLKAQK